MLIKAQDIFLVILLLVILSGCNVSVDRPSSLISDSLNTEYISLIEVLKNEYNVEIVFNKSSDWHDLLFGISFKPVDINEIISNKQYLSGIANEIKKYPSEFIEKIELRRIFLCENLAQNGFRRGGFADCKLGTIYLEFVKSSNFSSLNKSTIHHEIYHLFEKKNKGSIRHNDKKWRSINSPLFSYGNASRTSSNYNNRMFYPASGFVSKYAMSAEIEDRAELFAYLMTEEESYRVRHRCKTDEILSKKVEYLKKQILEYCDSMDQVFWDIIKCQKQESRFFNSKNNNSSNTVSRTKSSFKSNENSNKVQFDHNVSVEYIGITSDPNLRSTWWQPNGQKLADVPYTQVDKVKIPNDINVKLEKGLFKRYDLAFHIDGMAEENVHVLAIGSSYCANSYFTTDESGAYYSDFCNLLTIVPYETKSLDQILIMIRKEGWETKGFYKDGQSNYDIYSLKQGQVFLETFEFGGDVEVRIHGEIFKSTLDSCGIIIVPNLRLLVFDKNNKEPIVLIPNNTAYAIPPQLQTATFWLNDLKLDNIDKLELQTCDNEIRVLDNIMLPAKTKRLRESFWGNR